MHTETHAEHLNLLNMLQGGALWFQNLTELSHGYSGFIFPFLIAGLHYINVQVMEYESMYTRDIT